VRPRALIDTGPIVAIFTLDRRDFSIYRSANEQPFTLKPDRL